MRALVVTSVVLRRVRNRRQFSVASSRLAEWRESTGPVIDRSDAHLFTTPSLRRAQTCLWCNAGTDGRWTELYAECSADVSRNHNGGGRTKRCQMLPITSAPGATGHGPELHTTVALSAWL